MQNSRDDKHEYWKSRQTGFNKNIDVQLTIDKFGYDPNLLGSASKFKVLASCEFCLNKFETSMQVLNRKSSTSCKKCDAISSSYSRKNINTDKHEFYLSLRQLFDTGCLDIESTIKEYGHDPRELSSFSASKIVAKCGYCDKRLHIRMSKYSIRKGRITCWSHMRKKTVETLKERYGVECTLDIPSVREQLLNPKTEQLIESVIKQRYGVEYERNYSIGPYSFDFWIPSANLLLECQGDYYHDFKKNGYSGLPKDRSKSTYVEKYTDHKLVWIWEHELHMGRINKILDFHIHKSSETELSFDLYDLQFKPIGNREAHTFLSQYHYLGNLGTAATPYGSFYQDTLVAVCVFGGVTRQQSIKKINEFVKPNPSYGPKNVRELRRFCIRPNVISKNLASFSLKKFINLHSQENPETKVIISFSDTSVDDNGTIYKASNWIQTKDTTKSYHYLDTKTNKIIHKKTVWDSAKSNHMPEREFAVSSGLIRVEELPKKVWLKIL